ncbi:putative membrane protein [Cronobacter condimenti 1330]|uniref:Nickel/cobalt efflux system n=1 Tax=Cronobacter condimenti 1330 TaxID=1073999 RepID=K8ABZ9_9ENTR|nr:nickel/cobalt transporter [Cronobacter condimenti]ALB64218.1 nickel transporter [Cronobacter condimenti 1330]CCJ73314.1 putative membrane protein [Cronobacter condimenti 1330]
MSTAILNRRWQRPGVLLLALCALGIGFFLWSHWSAFLQWAFSLQITLHRYLVLYLLQLNNHQYTGGLWLISGAFIYGVLHAIGPGHGKFIVSAWLATNRENLFAARLVPVAGSLMQGISAIAFVFILAVGFNLASGDLSQSRWYLEKASALLIGAFGLFLILRAARSLRAPRLNIHALKPIEAHPDHCGCGHHGVGQTAPGSDWRARLGVIIAIGARPCSGAIMIMLFANALGMVSWGIAAVMTMALGTALSIMALSLGVQYARNATTRLFDHGVSAREAQRIAALLRIVGGLALLIFAAVLFLTVIPVSPNGDYIAAGC